MQKLIVVFTIVVAVLGTVWSAPSRGELPADISKMMLDRQLPPDSLGVMVLRLADGQIVLAHGADKPLQPASTLKVLTAIVGLDRLGPAYRGRTEILTASPVATGVLKGDLILRGFANADFTWEEMQRLLQKLRHQGISEIDGDVVVDRGFFQPGRIDIGLLPFDESPEFRYNVIPDALLINTNLLQFDIDATEVDFQIRQTPGLDRVTIISNMTLLDRACDKWEDGWQIPNTVKAENGEIRIYLNGQFPKNCAQTVHISVLDRADYVDRLFRTLWHNLGGKFNGTVREVETVLTDNPDKPGLTRVLAEHRARPLAEVTRNINKVSDNTITRTIFLTLGAMSKQTSETVGEINMPTLKKAEREIHAWLKQHGIDDTELVLDNGSGLSRSARIKPAQLAAVLQVAYRSKWAPEFISSLPIVGVDGSMRNRLKSSPVAEFGRIKTGGLRDVVAVAGYIPDMNGQQHVVVAMLNHERAVRSGGRAIVDGLLDWVAKSGAPAGSIAAKSGQEQAVVGAR